MKALPVRALPWLAFLLLAAASARAERYGVFEYTPPPGQRTEDVEGVTFSEEQPNNTSFIVYSRPSRHQGSPRDAFFWEWRRWTFQREVPEPEEDSLPGGWMVAYQNETDRNSDVSRSVRVYIGHGVRASVVVTSFGKEAVQRHGEKLDAAIKSLKLVDPRPVPLPSGFSLQAPKSFQQDQGLFYRWEPARVSPEDDSVGVSVRVLEPIPTKDSAGKEHDAYDALSFLARTEVGPMAAAGHLLVRRRIGNGAFAWFLATEARMDESEQKVRVPLRVTSLLLVPIGEVWVPIVAHHGFSTRRELEQAKLEAAVRRSLDQSSVLLEEFLATIRVHGQAAMGWEPDSLVGDWKAGNGANPNVYVLDPRTGDRTRFEIGSSLQLLKDGSFSGILKGKRMQGKFRVDGDRLVLSPSTGQAVVYRIASLSEPHPGRRALLLVPAERYPTVNAMSISGPGTLLLLASGG
ncbi:MAG: hypothetical protein WHU10_02115 [Fimbriimonadales bacterium]